jgi:catechol 2,3-dioxygenase-like lactoylglutathione lyase family enzyme
MITTRRIGHATFETPDVERQIDYYVNIFGLTLTEREKDRAFLSTRLGQQVVVLEQGQHARCTKLAFESEPDENLAAVQKSLRSNGIVASRKSGYTPAVSDVLSFVDPKGTEIEIFTHSRIVAADPTPAGICVLKLGHLAFNVADIQQVVAFYRDVLGFRVSDWRGDFFVFMRCGPDHHTVNFVSHGDHVKMHHIAFEVKDWSEIQRACDFLGKHNYHLVWGPGRHIIGHNVFIYHRNPDGQIMELYCELDQIKDESHGAFDPKPWHQDCPQKPKVWPADTLGNYWGGRAPPGFGD